MASFTVRKYTGASTYVDEPVTIDWSDIVDRPTTFAPTTHNHSTTNITSGTLTVARGGTGRTTLGSNNVLGGNGTSSVQLLSRSGIDTRTAFPTNVANISASGTPSASTYLRGDGTWATPPSGGGGGGSTAWVSKGYVSGTAGSWTIPLSGTETEFYVAYSSILSGPANADEYMIVPRSAAEDGADIMTLPKYTQSSWGASTYSLSLGWDPTGQSGKYVSVFVRY